MKRFLDHLGILILSRFDPAHHIFTLIMSATVRISREFSCRPTITNLVFHHNTLGIELCPIRTEKLRAVLRIRAQSEIGAKFRT
jgi:hypothetical protein